MATEIDSGAAGAETTDAAPSPEASAGSSEAPGSTGPSTASGEGEPTPPAKESAEATAERLAGEDKKPLPDEDPELEYEPGQKLKRSELKRMLQDAKDADSIRKGSYKKFEEAASIRKEAAQFLQAIQKDPIAALRELHRMGHLPKDPLEIAAEQMEREVAFAQMTPEQRQQYERDQLLAQFQAQEQNRQAEAKQARFAEEQRKYEQQLDKDLSDVFKEYGLAKSISMMARIGARLSAFANQGILPETETVKLAGRQAVDDLRMEVAQLAEHLDAETLRNLFPALVKKVHGADVSRVLAAQAPSAAGKAPAAKPAPKVNKPQPFKSFADFRDSIYSQPE